jgi:hypothetical protein
VLVPKNITSKQDGSRGTTENTTVKTSSNTRLFDCLYTSPHSPYRKLRMYRHTVVLANLRTVPCIHILNRQKFTQDRKQKVVLGTTMGTIQIFPRLFPFQSGTKDET